MEALRRHSFWLLLVAALVGFGAFVDLSSPRHPQHRLRPEQKAGQILSQALQRFDESITALGQQMERLEVTLIQAARREDTSPSATPRYEWERQGLARKLETAQRRLEKLVALAARTKHQTDGDKSSLAANIQLAEIKAQLDNLSTRLQVVGVEINLAESRRQERVLAKAADLVREQEKKNPNQNSIVREPEYGNREITEASSGQQAGRGDWSQFPEAGWHEGASRNSTLTDTADEQTTYVVLPPRIASPRVITVLPLRRLVAVRPGPLVIGRSAPRRVTGSFLSGPYGYSGYWGSYGYPGSRYFGRVYAPVSLACARPGPRFYHPASSYLVFPSR